MTRWLWVGLLGALWLPLPFPGMPIPERGAPIIYLAVAGLGYIAILLAGISRPLGLFFGYLTLRVVWDIVTHVGHGQMAGMLLGLLAMAALLFLAARDLPAATARTGARVFLAVAALQGLLGLLNKAGEYPSLLWIDEGLGLWKAYLPADFPAFAKVSLAAGFSGTSAGWLTHPNYLGSCLALAAPVALVALGPLGGLAGLLMTASTFSIGATVSALAGLAVLVRPNRKVVAGALLVLAAVATVHYRAAKEWDLNHLTSGRYATWVRGFSHVKEHPLFGEGLSSWRMWSWMQNSTMTAPKVTLGQGKGWLPAQPPADGQAVEVTHQAHFELLQLQFELGLVGLGLILAAAVHLGRRAWHVAHTGAPWQRVWVAVLVAAVVNSFGSPTFHLPGHAGVALFAAARVYAATRQ